MRKHKISIDKVQEAFNAAIKRRDMRCMIRDYEPCSGQLECSHFYTVGSSPALRFYPPNAWTQCNRHHFNHHNKWEKNTDRKAFEASVIVKYCEDLDYMESHRNSYIKYTDELKELIEKELG